MAAGGQGGGAVNQSEPQCPTCHVVLQKREQGFWQCPECGGEWWPPDPLNRRDIISCFLEEMRRGIRKGGSHKSKRRYRPQKRFWRGEFL